MEARQLNRLLKEIAETVASHYKTISADVADKVDGLPKVVATGSKKAIDSAYFGLVDSAIPAAGVLSQIASKSFIQGAPQKKWWDKQGSHFIDRLQQIVRMGVIGGFNNSQIISDVVAQFGVSERDAAALVHTTVQTVANNARLETFKKNDDIIKALEWVATLDGHTCIKCMPRGEGLQWKLDGTPIGHDLVFLNPPIHFNDRCVLVPVTKTFRELGLDIDELPPAERPSAGDADNSVVSSSVKFGDFLDRKGKAFQDSRLGPRRAELWRDGKITLRDLIDGQGRELTLEEMGF